MQAHVLHLMQLWIAMQKNLEANCAAWDSLNIVTLTACATDECDDTVTVTSNYGSLQLTPDSCGITGSLTVTYTLTDDCGNPSTFTATYEVIDTTPPVIDCPSDTTIACIDLVPEPSPGSVVASDECNEVVVTWGGDVLVDTSSCNPVLERTYIATDACGNMDTCIQTFTVLDTFPPVVFIEKCLESLDAEVECDLDNLIENCDEWNNSNIINLLECAHDDCSMVSVTSDYDIANLADSCGNTGSLLVTYTISDNCGNAITMTGVYEIVDNTPPMIRW